MMNDDNGYASDGGENPGYHEETNDQFGYRGVVGEHPEEHTEETFE